MGEIISWCRLTYGCVEKNTCGWVSHAADQLSWAVSSFCRNRKLTAPVTSFQHLPVLSNRVLFWNAVTRVVCFGLVATDCVAVVDALMWGLLTVWLSACSLGCFDSGVDVLRANYCFAPWYFLKVQTRSTLYYNHNPCLICANKLENILGPHYSAECTVLCFSWLYTVMFGFRLQCFFLVRCSLLLFFCFLIFWCTQSKGTINNVFNM